MSSSSENFHKARLSSSLTAALGDSRPCGSTDHMSTNASRKSLVGNDSEPVGDFPQRRDFSSVAQEVKALSFSKISPIERYLWYMVLDQYAPHMRARYAEKQRNNHPYCHILQHSRVSSHLISSHLVKKSPMIQKLYNMPQSAIPWYLNPMQKELLSQVHCRTNPRTKKIEQSIKQVSVENHVSRHPPSEANNYYKAISLKCQRRQLNHPARSASSRCPRGLVD
jgi:hypothetical protein